MSRRRLIQVVGGVVVLLAVVAVVRPRTYYPFLPNGHAAVTHSDSENLTVDASIPEFGRTTIDTAIRVMVTEMMFEPLAAAADEHEHPPGRKDEATITYRVPYRTLRYAGVVIDVVVDSHDHPAHYVIVRTLDLWRDRVLTVDDFSVSTNDPLKTLAPVVRFQLEGRDDIDPRKISQILKPKPSIFASFIARRDGLEFYFNPGMLAAPERGIIVVHVPWKALKPDLEP